MPTTANYILKTKTGRIAYETVLCDIHRYWGEAVALAHRQAEDDVNFNDWRLIEARDTDCITCSIQEEPMRA